MWTEQQKKAIDIRDTNVLVSAAAGSGKTAVLTERILKKLVSGETQADRLVVVTFTKAAAAEMRERIRRGLEKCFSENPTDKRLYVQMTLLSDADICTIDSFCNKLVKTHFAEVGIAPDYRIPEDAELKLLKSDVFSEVIEEFYKEGSEDFFEFATAFSSAKNDAEIEEIIDSVYERSQNKPWPDEWLETCLSNTALTEPEGHPLILSHIERIKHKINEYISAAEAAAKKIYEGSGIEKYKPFLEKEIISLKELCETDGAYEFYTRARALEFDRIPGSSRQCDEELKELSKGIRDSYKKYLSSLVSLSKDALKEDASDYYIGGRISENDALYIKKMTELIIAITRRFAEALESEKRKRNLVTFADIEHLALKLLIKREGSVSELTQTALELKDFYDEILTDEYQDSNDLQEEILNAIATSSNRYMVGDVKQSIYGFRGGDPSIFLGKYYEAEGSKDKNNELIILQNNFRSREGVLNACNKIFASVMNREYTGISYEKKEWLTPSFEFKKHEGSGRAFEGDDERAVCEVVLCSKEEQREPEELEGIRIAEIIKGYIREGFKVYDAKAGEYRPLTLRDCVVLTRKVSTGAAIAEVLNAQGLPAYSESMSSYIDTYEIRPVISFLKVIDNPLDDVEFTAFMLSFFGGFSAEELALLRSECKDDFFYRGLLELREPEKKLSSFLEKYHRMRELASSVSVYDLLWQIIYETGYYSYVGSMPEGAARLSNLDLLLSRAYMFTGTSYNGLFQFLRYVEKLEETDKAKGEISSVSELQDVVRIMTIHKSKGLEFPVVFLAGMEKQLNLRDATDKEKYIINENTIVTDVFDTKRKVKRISAFKKSLQSRLKQLSVSEELRLLYVAMTRAVEKLYIIGTYKGDDIKKAAGEAYIYKALGQYGFCDLDSASTYLKLFLPVVLESVKEGEGLFSLVESCADEIKESPADTFESVIKAKAKEEKSQEEVLEIKDFVYPYEEDIYAKPKLTVTELKTMSYADESESALDYRSVYSDEAKNELSTFSEFTEDDNRSGAGRGTLYHKLLEHIDFTKCSDVKALKQQIKSLTAAGFLPEEAGEIIEAGDIETFINSDIGQRVKRAFEAGRLRREQQFMIEKGVLVQGVIDMWFEEDDGELVVIDYKTDRVSKRNGDSILKKRYDTQLEIYGKALSAATGKRVKERIIYSFGLGRAIVL